MLDPAHDLSLGSEVAYCPRCELKHTRRPDWLCPRCGTPAESEPPVHEARRAPEPPPELDFPRGSTLAGALLVVSGGALAIVFAKHPGSDHRWPLVVAALIVGVLGLELLLKVAFARWAAIALAVVAAALVAEDLIRVRLPELFRDPLPPGVRDYLRDLIVALWPARILYVTAFAAGCVLLLGGRPRRVRIAVGVLLAAPLLVELARACAR